MGMFSWLTSDTERSIANRYSDRETFPVYVLQPHGAEQVVNNGEPIMEDNYDGYGTFGGHDVYDLLARWNCPKEMLTGDPDKDREIGISLYFDQKYKDVVLKFPIKIVENKELDYHAVGEARHCPNQGYFYEW